LNGDYSNWSADRISQIRGDSYYNSTWSWNTLTLPQWEVATADEWHTLLVDATASYSFNYTYDAAGNIIAQTDPDSGAITTSTYDHTNRLLTAEDASGITTYTYDANGNQTSIEEANGDVTTNTWDGENRLVQVEHPDFTMTTYVYDADGHRIEKDDGVDVIRFVYDGNNVVQERDDVGTVEAEFTYIPAAYAQVISQRRDVDSSFYAFDGIANTVALTNDAAVVTDEYALTAWGEQRSSTGSTANSQIYKGQFLAYYNDPNAGPETSLYSTHHRNYSAKQKQFTSSDPSESDINSSRYVKNNPINEVDPSGLEEIQTGEMRPLSSRSAIQCHKSKNPTTSCNFSDFEIRPATTFQLPQKTARMKRFEEFLQLFRIVESIQDRQQIYERFNSLSDQEQQDSIQWYRDLLIGPKKQTITQSQPSIRAMTKDEKKWFDFGTRWQSEDQTVPAVAFTMRQEQLRLEGKHTLARIELAEFILHNGFMPFFGAMPGSILKPGKSSPPITVPYPKKSWRPPRTAAWGSPLYPEYIRPPKSNVKGSQGTPIQSQLRGNAKRTDTNKFSNSQKGRLGELRTAQTMRRAGYDELPATLPSNQGFDGVWVKRGADGNLTDIVITESKFSATGKLKLSDTKTMGRQLSTKWINANIQKMLDSPNPSTYQTGKLLDANKTMIRLKAAVTNPQGVQRFSNQ